MPRGNNAANTLVHACNTTALLRPDSVQIGAVLPHRNLPAIQHRLRRLTHSGRGKGKWTEKEEQLLLDLHSKLGSAWAKIGEHVGRLPIACRDKLRTLKETEAGRTGRWSSDEEDRLREACFIQFDPV